MLIKIKKFLLDLIFPIQCLGGCGAWDTWFCPNCLYKIEKYPHILENPSPSLRRVYFACDYTEIISKLVHCYKYKYIPEISQPLAKIMSYALPSDEKFDCLVFVPLHKKKELLRSFNQTYLLAKYISKITNIPIIKGTLQRKKKTEIQAQLNKKQRLENVKNAFICANKNAVKNKRLLLIDDIYTTGSTLEACAKCLKQAGAKHITGLVIAKGHNKAKSSGQK